MSKFIEQIKKTDKAMVNVFGHYIFENLNLEKEVFQFMKKLPKKEAQFFSLGMPEKWWEKYFSETEDINNEDFEKLDRNFYTILNSFETIYDKENRDIHYKVLELREFLKAGFETCGTYSDQTKGVAVPPIEKEYDKNSMITELPKPDENIVIKKSIFQCITDRKSRRKFSNQELTIDELSYLLWATQGVRGFFRNNTITMRTVPSGGARQPFETYLAINYVQGLGQGVYRYLPSEHKLVYLFSYENMKEKLTDSAMEQDFAGECAVCFIWSAVPYRCEWRYTTEAKKIIAQDSGHLCQNLYLAAESINCGTCAIGAYSQKKMDEFIRVDGTDEFVVYMAPVGKVSEKGEE